MDAAARIRYFIETLDLTAVRKAMTEVETLPEPEPRRGTSWGAVVARSAWREAAAVRVDGASQKSPDPKAQTHRQEMLRFLVEHDQPIDGTDERGRSTLELAAVGDAALLRSLLDLGLDAAGAGPAARRSGRTPLFAAAEAGNLESVRVLLEAGADASIPDGHGRTPISAAYREGHDSVVSTLEAAGASLEPATPGVLHAAVVRHNQELLRACIALGNLDQIHGQGPPSDWNPSGSEDTPLLLSLLHGNDEALDLLLAAGAEVTGDGPDFPLEAATTRGNLSAVEKLLAAGADPHRDFCGWDGRFEQPAHVAARFGHVEILRRLLDAGVKPMVRDDQKTTLLHAAADGLRPACVQLLLERNADPHRKGGHDNAIPRKDAEATSPTGWRGSYGYPHAAKRKKTDKAETIRLLTAAEKAKPKQPTARKKKPTPAPAAWRSAPFELPPPTFERDPSPEAVALLQEAFGPAQPWPEIERVLLFRADPEEAALWIREHHEELAAMGCRAVGFCIHPILGADGAGVILLPRRDLVDAIALLQTNGVNSGIGPGHVAAALEELRELSPFIVTSLGHDRVDAIFTETTRSTTKLARFVADLCPDAGSTSAEVAALAKDLKENGRLLLWWD